MTEPTDDRHLDDDTLSAVLDGEATPAESRHADGCPTCSARLGALREASMLVRTPIAPPPAEQRDGAVAAALGALDASKVAPLRRRAAPPVWLAAAAAVAVVVGAVALLAGRGGDGDQVADGDETAQLQSEVGGTTGADSMMAAVAPVDAGDLGALDGLDLRVIVTERLDRAASRAGGGGVEDAAAIPCDDTVRAGNELLGPLVLHGAGTYQGEPVVLLAYDVVRDDGVDRWVYVLEAGGCVIRNQQTFSA